MYGHSYGFAFVDSTNVLTIAKHLDFQINGAFGVIALNKCKRPACRVETNRSFVCCAVNRKILGAYVKA